MDDGNCPIPEQFPEVRSHFLHVVGSLARRLLEAVAASEPAGHLASALAEAVLLADEPRLAREVLAGGPHALTRAIELADLVLKTTVPCVDAQKA
ncbi:MAG TPA: hypothetical protein VGJ84_12215 [Polyangiaceae bacterium]